MGEKAVSWVVDVEPFARGQERQAGAEGGTAGAEGKTSLLDGAGGSAATAELTIAGADFADGGREAERKADDRGREDGTERHARSKKIVQVSQGERQSENIFEENQGNN